MKIKKKKQILKNSILCTVRDSVVDLTSNQNQKPAGIFVRLAAYIIDVILCGICTFILHGALYTSVIDIAMPFLIIYPSMLYLGLYFLICENSKWSASIGKKLFELKVKKSNGEPSSFLRILLRTCMYLFGLSIDSFLIPFALVSCIMSGGLTACLLVALLILFSGFLWYLPMLFTKNKVCLHDLLSGTKVVHEQN